MVFAWIVLSRELIDVRIFAVPWALPEEQQVNQRHEQLAHDLPITVGAVAAGRQGFICIAHRAVKWWDQRVAELVECDETLDAVFLEYLPVHSCDASINKLSS